MLGFRRYSLYSTQGKFINTPVCVLLTHKRGQYLTKRAKIKVKTGICSAFFSESTCILNEVSDIHCQDILPSMIQIYLNNRSG